jgi:gamma-glutamyl-gamma-aminobutyrate hydrolase PuuD
MGRPIIGLTTYRENARWGVWDRLADIQSTLYTDAIAASGGAVVLVPPAASGVLDVLRALDGLLISGGADVDPATYSAEAHPAAGPFRADRDDAELALVRAAVEHGVPVLGICRGLQVLNVALGGDLIQHLPEIEGVLPHAEGRGIFSTRAVTLDSDSWIGRTLGAGVPTACHHHQAVDRVAPGLRIVGRADDGTPEALEAADGRPVFGVQWHPEQLDDRRLFEAFVGLAAERAAAALSRSAPAPA